MENIKPNVSHWAITSIKNIVRRSVISTLGYYPTNPVHKFIKLPVCYRSSTMIRIPVRVIVKNKL